jgi:amino acid adenylation domain-containing protein
LCKASGKMNFKDASSLRLDADRSVDQPSVLLAASALEGSIIDRFDAIVRQFPSRVAIQDMEASVAYAELAVLVDRIAAATVAATKGRPGPVAVLLAANATLPAALLGVLAAGRAYVTLDANFPGERNRLIISEAGACAVISSSDITGRAREYFPRGLPVVDIHDLSGSGRPDPGLRPGPDDLAAIYYTSGSSGHPKGIALSHRVLLHWVQLFTDVAQITCADRTLLVYSANVSASYRSIYCALLNGASLHILPPLDLGLAALSQQIRARGITIYHSVPTLMRRITESVGAGERLDTIRVAYVAGDRFKWSDADECRRCFSPNVSVHSGLSSTETGPFIHSFVDDALRPTSAHPPLGRPVPDCTVTIVDDDGEPVVDGECGRIVVTSRFIALGYWQGSVLEIRAFPSDPTDPRARVFASGDIGRRRADGLIEFVGRHDDLVKLHGQRIEPAEVESVLTALKHVSDAAVAVRRSEDGTPLSLVAYVVLRSGIKGLLPRHVQSMLAQRLPHYMVPSRIYLVGELPRLPNFKIDRRALAQMDNARACDNRERHHDPLVDKIADIFASVIRIGVATPDDTVASLGGDSLQELDVFAELERRYGVKVSDEMIKQRPTIRSIAGWLAQHIADTDTGEPPR